MPSRRLHPSFDRTLLRIAPIVVGICLALEGCGGDNFYPGQPLSDAEVTLSVAPLPESSVARYARKARWKVPSEDFSRFPYLLEIRNTTTGRRIEYAMASPIDSIVDTFSCTQQPCTANQFAASVLAVLQKGTVLQVGTATGTVTP